MIQSLHLIRLYFFLNISITLIYETIDIVEENEIFCTIMNCHILYRIEIPVIL